MGSVSAHHQATYLYTTFMYPPLQTSRHACVHTQGTHACTVWRGGGPPPRRCACIYLGGFSKNAASTYIYIYI